MNIHKLLIILVLSTGCQQPKQPSIDPYIVKRNDTWEHQIKDPFEWSKIQIKESDPIDKDENLCFAEADIDNDGFKELFIHADVPARLYIILVFKKYINEYKYIGCFSANPYRIVKSSNNELTSYAPCGGHNGYVVKYVSDGKRFVEIYRSNNIHSGDGAPEYNNEFIKMTFNRPILKWEKYINNQ